MSDTHPNNTPERESFILTHRKTLINSSVGAQGWFRKLYTPAQAEEAITARRSGDWSNVELLKLGALLNNLDRDVSHIKCLTTDPGYPKFPLFDETKLKLSTSSIPKLPKANLD